MNKWIIKIENEVTVWKKNKKKILTYFNSME